MMNASNKLTVWFFLAFLLAGPTPAFSESIEDGYITRTDTPVILKDGSPVPCNSILWLTKTADFLQCDQDGTFREIKIDRVDLEKTFGPKIADTYKAYEFLHNQNSRFTYTGQANGVYAETAANDVHALKGVFRCRVDFGNSRVQDFDLGVTGAEGALFGGKAEGIGGSRRAATGTGKWAAGEFHERR